MLLLGREYIAGAENYRFGINGQERDDEIYGNGNSYTAEFWQYDPRLMRRWNVDPKPNPSFSVYSTFQCNPILNSDVLGDTIVVDKKGYITRNDKTDNLVFTMQKGKYTQIGEVGKSIDIDIIYTNLLKVNIKKARSMTRLDFYNKVKGGGDWDLKNNESTIYGLAYKYQKQNITGKTTFLFEEKEMSAPDVGNYHFGVVGLANDKFSETTLLKQAGQAQINSDKSKPEWQPTYTYNVRTADGIQQRTEMLPPYGDDPEDQKMIKEGFEFYKNVTSGK